MAESDPKKVRPFAHSPARPDFESEEDPLVELARIVSEDSGFYARADKSRPPQQPRRDEPIDRNAPSADLESELLQELESSFAPRSSPVPPASRVAAQPPKPPLPADDADDLLRSIEEQLGEFERRSQTTHSPRPEPEMTPELMPEPIRREPAPDSRRAEMDPAEMDSDPYVSASELEDSRPQRRDGNPPRRDDPVEPRPSLHAVESRQPARVPPQRGDVRPTRGPAGAAGRGNPAEHRRPAPVGPRRREASEAEAASRSPAGEGPRRRPARSGFAAGNAAGWREIESGEQPKREPGSAHRRAANVEAPRDLRTTSGDLDEAREPVRQEKPAAASVEADRGHQLEPRYSDPTSGGRWREAEDPEPRKAAPEREVAIAPAQGGGAGGAASDPERRRSGRKGLVTVALVLAVAAIGGAAAYYMRTTEEVGSGPPPVIAAPDGAVKVEAPPEQRAESETVGEAVYSRVAGEASTQGEQVVEGAEEPAEISRIVLPPPPEPEPAPAQPVPVQPTPAQSFAEPQAAPPPAGQNPASAAVAEENLPVGPRRVRTFVVRPDGTISSSEEGAAAASEPAPPPIEQQVASVAAEMTPGDPVRVPTSEVDGSAEIPAEPLTDEPFEASAEPNAASEPTPAPPPEPTPAPAASAPAASAPAASAPAAPEPVPPDAPAASGASGAAAESDASGETPILPDLAATETPSAPPGDLASVSPAEPAASPPVVAADGFVVQVSSQKSEAQAQAAFADLQRRYPSALGGMQPNIQQADLGAKGIFYRVRVGPWPSRAEAIEVCEAMQAAGGSCFVTR